MRDPVDDAWFQRLASTHETRAQRRRSRGWYLVALGVALLGLAAVAAGLAP